MSDDVCEVDGFTDAPDSPIIYRLICDDSVIYVGQTINLNQRLIAHKYNGLTFNKVAYRLVDECEMNNEEAIDIAKYKPTMNKSMPKNDHWRSGAEFKRALLDEVESALERLSSTIMFSVGDGKSRKYIYQEDFEQLMSNVKRTLERGVNK